MHICNPARANHRSQSLQLCLAIASLLPLCVMSSLGRPKIWLRGNISVLQSTGSCSSGACARKQQRCSLCRSKPGSVREEQTCTTSAGATERGIFPDRGCAGWGALVLASFLCARCLAPPPLQHVRPLNTYMCKSFQICFCPLMCQGLPLTPQQASLTPERAHRACICKFVLCS